MPSLTPFLWLDGRAAEAAAFYRSVFPDAEAPEGGGGTGGAVTVRLLGQTVILFDGGPHYRLTPAASLLVRCDTQAEIDHYWDRLLQEGGTPLRCGWLTDRFGVTWQVVPGRLAELLADPDPARARAVRDAMLGMGRLDIAALERAREGA